MYAHCNPTPEKPWICSTCRQEQQSLLHFAKAVQVQVKQGLDDSPGQAKDCDAYHAIQVSLMLPAAHNIADIEDCLQSAGAKAWRALPACFLVLHNVLPVIKDILWPLGPKVEMQQLKLMPVLIQAVPTSVQVSEKPVA